VTRQSILQNNELPQCHTRVNSYRIGSHFSSFLAKSVERLLKLYSIQAVTFSEFDDMWW